MSDGASASSSARDAQQPPPPSELSRLVPRHRVSLDTLREAQASRDLEAANEEAVAAASAAAANATDAAAVAAMQVRIRAVARDPSLSVVQRSAAIQAIYQSKADEEQLARLRGGGGGVLPASRCPRIA